jgi:hypothetical protein
VGFLARENQSLSSVSPNTCKVEKTSHPEAESKKESQAEPEIQLFKRGTCQQHGKHEGQAQG